MYPSLDSEYIMGVRLVWHNRVFNETAIGIRDALLLLGIDAEGSMVDQKNTPFEQIYINESTTLFIIIGFHRCTDKLPPAFVAVQSEQPGSKWFSKMYFDRLSKALAVWDFSPRNVVVLSSRGLSNVHLVPTRVPMTPYIQPTTPSKLETFTAPIPEDIDVLFYGANHPRRRCIEESLRMKGLNTVFRYYNLFDEERDSLIERAKVVLNIHYWPESSLETHRVEYLCSKGKCVISETSMDPVLDQVYKDSIKFCSYQDIVRETHLLCTSVEERRTMEYRAYHSSMRRQLDVEPLAVSLGL